MKISVSAHACSNIWPTKFDLKLELERFNDDYY